MHSIKISIDLDTLNRLLWHNFYPAKFVESGWLDLYGWVPSRDRYGPLLSDSSGQ